MAKINSVLRVTLTSRIISNVRYTKNNTYEQKEVEYNLYIFVLIVTTDFIS